MSDCIRGCRRRYRHLDACTGTRDDGNECTGCQPRRASHGLLCWPCHRRLEQWLSNGPNSLAYAEYWLEANLPKGSGTRFDVEVRSEPEREPINLERWDTLTLLRDQVLGWLETHCKERNLTGPDTYTIQTASTYLTAWLDKLEESEWVRDMWDELAETMSQAHALAPWRPAVRRCPGIPCPECEECRLVIYGGEVDITCQSCYMMYTRETYDRWVYMLAEERAEA